MVDAILQDAPHHLVDTSYAHNRTIDVEQIAGRAFGPSTCPLVWFLMGPWLGRRGNRIINHERFIKFLEIEDQKVDQQLELMLLPYRMQAFLYRYEGALMDELLAIAPHHGLRGYYFPQFTDTEAFRDWSLSKRYDVLFYGSTVDYLYPLRARLQKLLTACPGGLRVKVIDSRSGTWGAATSRMINQSWLTVSDRVGDCDRFVGKYSEIPLSGSVLLGNAPTRHRDLFRGRMVEVDMSMSDQAILDAIHSALADKDRLHAMAQSLRSTMLEQYTLAHGRERFWSIMSDLQNL